MMASDAPVQSSMGCHLETCWNWHPAAPRIRLARHPRHGRCPRYKNHGNFWENQYQKLSHQPVCDTQKKNIYIYVAPTVLICVFFLGYFFLGGEYRLPKTNIAPFFVWVFGTSGGTWTACIWLFTTSKGHATSQPRRLRRCLTTPPPRGWLTCPTLVYP